MVYVEDVRTCRYEVPKGIVSLTNPRYAQGSWLLTSMDLDSQSRENGIQPGSVPGTWLQSPEQGMSLDSVRVTSTINSEAPPLYWRRLRGHRATYEVRTHNNSTRGSAAEISAGSNLDAPAVPACLSSQLTSKCRVSLKEMGS